MLGVACWTLVVFLNFSAFLTKSVADSNLKWKNKPKKYQKMEFPQILDHFSIVDKRTFYQHYYINDDYCNSDSVETIILFIGGEYELKSEHISQGFITVLAQKLKALILGIEHRHYGHSVLSTNYTKTDFNTLTSQQALADLIFFQWHIKDLFPIRDDVKWITMGGSYAGMLASWARIKYPHLFFAAYASSAPVKAELRFDGFLKLVANGFSNPLVNGSLLCKEKINETFKEIDKIYYENTGNTKNQQDYDSYLHSCRNTVTTEDKRNLVSEVVDILSSVVQYNTQDGKLNIGMTCVLFKGISDPWKRISSFLDIFLKINNISCINIDLFTDYLHNETTMLVTPTADIAWYYQTCREFGYNLHCDRSEGCIFSDLIKLSPELKLCSKLFGINDHMISGYVDYTNSYYGRKQQETSRIIYVNGIVDPWRDLAVSEVDPSRMQALFEISVGSHHQEFNDPQPNEPDELVVARELIISILKYWIELNK